MKRPALHDAIEAIEGIDWVQRSVAPMVWTGVSFDSRAVSEGELFVALVGAASDGHAYIQSALDLGAAAVLVERDVEVPAGIDVLKVADTRQILGKVSAAVYGYPSKELEIVGITGTNGKTTSTYIMEAVARACGQTTGVIGTIEYRWPGKRRSAPNTTPESAALQRMFREMIEAGVQTVVMEVSSHGLSTHRVHGTLFDVAVFTNFSQDHLDFHGDLEAYKAAKLSLFQEHLEAAADAGKSPKAVVNCDDPVGRELWESLRASDASVLGYGKDSDVDLRWSVSERSLAGSVVHLEDAHGRLSFNVPLLGEFNVENAVGVWGAGLALGWDPSEMKGAFESGAVSVPGRMQAVGDGPAGFVDYAHTPDALKRALETLRPLTGGKLIVVFGCGGDRDRLKRPVMGEIARELADVVVVTSDNPRTEDPLAIISEIVGTSSAHVEPDREAAIRLATVLAGPDDVILIAGKGHETYQEIDGVRRDFDDVAVFNQALAGNPGGVDV